MATEGTESSKGGTACQLTVRPLPSPGGLQGCAQGRLLPSHALGTAGSTLCPWHNPVPQEAPALPALSRVSPVTPRGRRDPHLVSVLVRTCSDEGEISQ